MPRVFILWFFIVDLSIQMGRQKCVVVLGVKVHDIFRCPTFADIEPLVVCPVESCPGEVIQKLLEEACIAIDAVPKAIISDSGNEMKKGARLFIENNQSKLILAGYSIEPSPLILVI